jgi:hypothetical protein
MSRYTPCEFRRQQKLFRKRLWESSVGIVLRKIEVQKVCTGGGSDQNPSAIPVAINCSGKGSHWAIPATISTYQSCVTATSRRRRKVPARGRRDRRRGGSWQLCSCENDGANRQGRRCVRLRGPEVRTSVKRDLETDSLRSKRDQLTLADLRDSKCSKPGGRVPPP